MHIRHQLLKNQFYFYELGKRQPKGTHEPLQKSGSTVFDPSIGASSESMESRVQKVFGSLGSREESRKEAQAKGAWVAGIKVPARPEEPTNCCQSGCINCVWELFKDELEEWKQARRKAQTLLMKPENLGRPWPAILGTEPRGRHSGEQHHQEDEEDGLSVGIQAFIETEKRLHQRRRERERSRGEDASTPA